MFEGAPTTNMTAYVGMHGARCSPHFFEWSAPSAGYRFILLIKNGDLKAKGNQTTYPKPFGKPRPPRLVFQPLGSCATAGGFRLWIWCILCVLCEGKGGDLHACTWTIPRHQVC